MKIASNIILLVMVAGLITLLVRDSRQMPPQDRLLAQAFHDFASDRPANAPEKASVIISDCEIVAAPRQEEKEAADLWIKCIPDLWPTSGGAIFAWNHIGEGKHLGMFALEQNTAEWTKWNL